MKYILLLKHFKSGGGERVMLEVAKRLAVGNSVTLLVYGSVDSIYMEEVRAAGLKFDTRRNSFEVMKYLLREKLNGEKIFIISFLTPSNMLAAIARVFLGIHFNASIHLHPHAFERETLFKSLFRKIAYKFFINQSERTICVSTGVRDGVAKLVGSANKLTVSCNPVIGADFYLKSNIDCNLPEKFRKRKLIVGCGRIEHQKGFDLLLKAYAKYFGKNSHYGLIIVGDGALRDDIEKQAVSLGIDGDMWISGFVKNPLPIIKRADVFVLSSRYEGFGNVLAEALALKRRCVAFNCQSGPADILASGKYGILVEPGNDNALGQSMVAAEKTNISFFDSNEFDLHIQSFSSEMVAKAYGYVREVNV
jgi:glycosyltransferase involved in cell wall biosynthesis